MVVTEQEKVTRYVTTLLGKAGGQGMMAKQVFAEALKYKIVVDNTRSSRARVFGALRILRDRGVAVRIQFANNDSVRWYMKDKCPEKLLASAKKDEEEKPSEEWILAATEEIALELLGHKGYFTFLQFQGAMADHGKTFPYGYLKKACMRGINHLFTKGIIKKEDKRYMLASPDSLRTAPQADTVVPDTPRTPTPVANSDDSGTLTLNQVVEVRIITRDGEVTYQLEPGGQTVMIKVDGLTIPNARSIRYRGDEPVEIKILFRSGKSMMLSDVKDALIF